ncbi:hypothetical protein ZEAMMB73_Zm00001d044073 [Zea mays]|uniref:Uncharacterized protein n=1 Tax=Zea mays TaxID=4577 RepID=A0A1D6NHL0_MAIZE|nr:hypothetical protein ZEAMMB73_Zm00001d044073 [Zea mays]
MQSSALGFLLAQKQFTNALVVVTSAVSVVRMHGCLLKTCTVQGLAGNTIVAVAALGLFLAKRNINTPQVLDFVLHHLLLR